MTQPESVKCPRCKLTWSRRMVARVLWHGAMRLLCRDCREDLLALDRFLATVLDRKL